MYRLDSIVGFVQARAGFQKWFNLNERQNILKRIEEAIKKYRVKSIHKKILWNETGIISRILSTQEIIIGNNYEYEDIRKDNQNLNYQLIEKSTIRHNSYIIKEICKKYYINMT